MEALKKENQKLNDENEYYSSELTKVRSELDKARIKENELLQKSENTMKLYNQSQADHLLCKSSLENHIRLLQISNEELDCLYVAQNETSLNLTYCASNYSSCESEKWKIMESFQS